MKAKHLNTEEDKALYLEIRKEIKDNLVIKKKDADHYFIFKSIVYGALTTSTYSLLYFLENPVLFIIDFVAFGFIAVLLCFNFAHDFSHHAIFKKPFWDNIGFEFIYTLVGAHPEAWKSRHLNSHHYAPNVEHFDTDLAITGLIRVLPTSKLKWYHRFQHLYAPFAYATYSFYWVFIKDFIVLAQSKHLNYKNRLRYYFTFFAMKFFYVFYLFILPFYFGHQTFGTILIAGIAMHIVQSIYTLFTFFITHHVEGSNYPKADNNGLINTSWVMNQIKSSNNFYPFSQLGNFIFGGVNNHIAHHLFPNISHYHYPKLNVILFETLEKNGIKPSVTTYFGGIVSHLKLLKRMGKTNSVDLI